MGMGLGRFVVLSFEGFVGHRIVDRLLVLIFWASISLKP